MARLLLWIDVIGIIAGALSGCRVGVSRGVVEQAMSGKAGANIPGDEVRQVGEKAIPLIFDVVRDTTDEMIPQRALLLVIGMTAMHTADPSAPYIRQVLADQREPDRIRVLAAEMLSEYSRSPEPQRALIDHARLDTSEAVRVQCIASLGGLTVTKLYSNKTWRVEAEVQRAFSIILRDKDAKVRSQTCESVGGIAGEALYAGIDLAWCRQLLIQGKHDKEYAVRKAAVDDLFVLDSIRLKNRR